MPKSLLIVESPAKAKTIKKYVGDGFEVLASKGHIKDLPKRGGVDHRQRVPGDLRAARREGQGRGRQGHPCKTAKQRRTSVLLATDPDREGEAIAYHLMEESSRPAPTAKAEVSAGALQRDHQEGRAGGARSALVSSTRTSTRLSARAASSTASAATPCRACCGRSSPSGSPPGACRPRRCASSSTARRPTTSSSPRTTGSSTPASRVRASAPGVRWPTSWQVGGEKLPRRSAPGPPRRASPRRRSYTEATSSAATFRDRRRSPAGRAER